LRTLAFPGILLLLAGCGPDYKIDQVPARIVVSPDLADFGAVAVGDTVTADLTLTSVDGPDVHVVAADMLDIAGGYFTIPDDLPTVPSGGSATVTVTYTPEHEGYHLSRLTLTTDEERDNEHVVDLRGNAGQPSAQVWPLVVDFGPVAAGATATQTVTVLNDGAVDLTVASASFDADPFSLLSTVPVDLAAGAASVFTVQFAPTDTASATGSLSFDLGSVDVLPVELRGNACEDGAAALYDTDGDGVTSCGGDCDDTNADVHPGAVETCDGLDGDCDGTIDEGTSCSDDDGDGVSEDAGDCNDGDAAVSPSAAEDWDNGIDDDCDGVIDYGTVDTDGDGYAAEGGDCDVDDPTVYPGAPETADGADNDCDGIVDEGTVAYDDDGDGYTESSGDCDDGVATVHPLAVETADGVDDDCDGVVDEGTSASDDDGDGFTETGGDCDDGNAAVHPGAHEVTGDGLDNDCDGVTQ
jgi:hypothetical protein